MDVLPLVGVLSLVGILTGLVAAARKPVWQWLTFTFENSCACTSPGHAGMKENDRADRPVGKATITSGLLLGRSETLRSLRHHLPAQSQGRHTIDRQEERGVERGSARRSSLKGRQRTIVSQTNIGTVSKATLVQLLRDWVERIWSFPSA